jgi:hypothetical protein
MSPFAFRTTGWLFVLAAAMLWLGWVLLPARPGAFFVLSDFAAIRATYRRWIWLFRLHIFGYLLTVMGGAALATAVVGADARVLVWPGVAVLATGSIVGALGAAFYYHVGAWGALELRDGTPPTVEMFIAAVRALSHYATCQTRFGRVFFGQGQLVLEAGLLRADLLPSWLAAAAAVLGTGGIAVTMARPDELERYRPIFHLNAAWMLALGIAALRVGSGGAG